MTSLSSLVQWNVACWSDTDSSWSKRLWIGYRCFTPWQVYRRSSEHYKQWPSCPPQGRKLNYIISQQGALYNGVAVAFEDMLLEGGGWGKGFICYLLERFFTKWPLSINWRLKPGSKTSVFLPERYYSFVFSRIMGPAKVHWLTFNFCWNLCLSCWVEEHILSYCHNLWNYTENSSSSLVQWNVAFWMQTDSSWSKRLWIGYRCFLPWQVHRRSSEQNTSNGQATPPPGRKLNCRVLQQGILYNGVTVVFGDRLVKGGGFGEGVYL